MESIWLGLWPNTLATQIVVMRGASETILKAKLSLRPSSQHAVTALLGAIALWEGRPVRAVLVADERSTSSSPTTLYRDTRALHDRRAVVVRTASDLLADLAKQESSVARARRLEAYVRPQLLCIDEVGYLSYDVRHADLLFEVVARLSMTTMFEGSPITKFEGRA